MPFDRKDDNPKPGSQKTLGIVAIVIACVFTALVLRWMWLGRGTADYLKISSFVILAEIAVAIGISSLPKRGNR